MHLHELSREHSTTTLACDQQSINVCRHQRVNRQLASLMCHMWSAESKHAHHIRNQTSTNNCQDCYQFDADACCWDAGL